MLVFQFVEEKNWISGYIKFKFGVDGISILFIVLTISKKPILPFKNKLTRTSFEAFTIVDVE